MGTPPPPGVNVYKVISFVGFRAHPTCPLQTNHFFSLFCFPGPCELILESGCFDMMPARTTLQTTQHPLGFVSAQDTDGPVSNMSTFDSPHRFRPLQCMYHRPRTISARGAATLPCTTTLLSSAPPPLCVAPPSRISSALPPCTPTATANNVRWTEMRHCAVP